MKTRDYKLSDISVEDRKAVVAYCDVTGFMSWLKRASADHAESREFIRRLKFEFLKFRQRTGYFTIQMGDGIIIVVEMLSASAGRTAAAVLTETSVLARAVLRLIKGTPYPRPDGFRVRVTAGPVFMTEAPTPSNPGVTEKDYAGNPLNLGSRLLDVMREINCVVHDSAIDLLKSEDMHRLKFRHLNAKGHPPRNVDHEDMRGLWEFKIR